MVALSSAAVAQGVRGQAALPPLLEFRLADATQGPGLTERHESHRDDQPRVLFVASTAVVSDTDLVGARTSPARDGLVVEITLSEAAAARMRAATANNPGKYLAVFARGRLSGAAVVATTIPLRTSATVGLTLPPAAADSLRRLVADRWPARGRPPIRR
jgi:preprotein translocase subunit SecD